MKFSLKKSIAFLLAIAFLFGTLPIRNLTARAETGPEFNGDAAFVRDGLTPSQILRGGSGAVGDGMRLAFDKEYVESGETNRVFLDGIENVAISGITYGLEGAGAEDKLEIDKNGFLTIKNGYIPDGDEEITVKATVRYYEGDDVLFVDNFEGEKRFTDANIAGPSGNTHIGENASLIYQHSSVLSNFGRHAATPFKYDSSTNPSLGSTGVPTKTISAAAGEVTDVTVTAWYYDLADPAEMNSSTAQAKYAFAVRYVGQSTPPHSFGVICDSSLNQGLHKQYAYRDGKKMYNGSEPGVPNYSWDVSGAERTNGWHKFEWVIDNDEGLTMKIDGDIISVNPGARDLRDLQILCSWLNNTVVLANIIDKHFVDDVSVVKNGAPVKEEIVETTVKLRGNQYASIPAGLTFDLANPGDMTVTVTPDLDGLTGVALDGAELIRDEDYTVNGNRLTLSAGRMEKLSVGQYGVILNFGAKTHTITLKVVNNTPRSYYVSSMSGDDVNDGLTENTPWKTLDKLNEVVFNPGDKIYLDAKSVWNGQLKPKGSGREGKPIILTKYNDGGNSQVRPVINGNGTVASTQYESFSFRKFYPSGTLELIDVEYWEVSGLEITNYGASSTDSGRNGICVIHDYAKGKGSATQANFYEAGKKTHIYITDCYVHDVNGTHPAFQSGMPGGKMSGGINFYGPMDDVLVEGCTVMYCDNEGIRNDVLAWSGDVTAQFPHYMEGFKFNNNYIAHIPGDAMVISSVVGAEASYNYVTDCGRSYLTQTNGTPRTMGSYDPVYLGTGVNFAALWFIGAKDTVAQYNEVVNNPYRCIDGEAFDVDMWCDGVVYQYNYTARNSGGFILLMHSSPNTILRHNISVEDGYGDVNTAPHIIFYQCAGRSQTSSGYPSGAPTAAHFAKIYNNTFIVADTAGYLFGADTGVSATHNTHVYFQNNIVASANPDKKLEMMGHTGSLTKNLNYGEFTNNIFYPAAMLQNSVLRAGVTNESNIYLDPQLVDIGAIPAGVLVNSGTKDALFDVSKLGAFKLKQGSPAIGAGVMVTPHRANQNTLFPLENDIFGNPVEDGDTPDIGAHQYSNDPDRGKAIHKITFDIDGQTGLIAPSYISEGRTVSAPQALSARPHYTFDGWYTDAACRTPFDFDAPITGGQTLYGMWRPIRIELGAQTISVAAPVAGRPAQSEIAPGDGYTGSVDWRNDTDGAALVGPAQAMKVYTATVTLTAEEDYYWPEFPVIAVPSQTVENIKVNGDGNGNSVSFTVTFAPTAEVNPATGISITGGDRTLNQGFRLRLDYSMDPIDSTSQITWASDNESVATVHNGYVYGAAPGEANITATANGHSSSVKVTVGAYAEDEFDDMRKRWSEFLLCTDYDPADGSAMAVINGYVAIAEQRWKDINMDADGSGTEEGLLWKHNGTGSGGSYPTYGGATYTLSGTTPRSSNWTPYYQSLLNMTRAFVCEDSPLYQNRELYDAILFGINWMDTCVNTGDSTYVKPGGAAPKYGVQNWWDREIGFPRELNNLITLLYPYLDEATRESYNAKVTAYLMIEDNTITQNQSANRVDRCKSISLNAILKKNGEQLKTGLFLLYAPNSGVLNTATSGNGVYYDGSYIDHTTIAYTGSYGFVLLEGISHLYYMVGEHSGEYPFDARLSARVAEVLESSFLPIMYKGVRLNSVNGRAISRQEQSVLGAMGDTLPVTMLMLAGGLPEKADYYKGIVKTYLSENPYIIPKTSVLLNKKMLEGIVGDSGIAAVKEPTGVFAFNRMARSTIRRDGYVLDFAMQSSRIAPFEYGNAENLKGFHTGDGVMYLYNGDITHYLNNYWATVDYKRLPGTTADTVPMDLLTLDSSLASGTTATRTNKNIDYAAGSKLDDYAAVGFHLDQSVVGTSDYYPFSNLSAVAMDLVAYKSWFVFDREVVALGSGITSGKGRAVETTIEQRKVTGNPSTLTVNGIEKVSTPGAGETLSADWAHLAGSITGTDIGYYFPKPASVNILRENRTGSWFDINKGDNTYDPSTKTDEYVTMYLGHGVNPVNGTYEYAVLPNLSKAETEAYADDPQFEVLSNEPGFHAVHHKGLDITAVNNFLPTAKTAGGITVDREASVMVRVYPADYDDAALAGKVKASINRILDASGHPDVKVTLSAYYFNGFDVENYESNAVNGNIAVEWTDTGHTVITVKEVAQLTQNTWEVILTPTGLDLDEVVILQQPAASTTVREGGISATLSLLAINTKGGGLTYQWYKAPGAATFTGVPVSGATGSVFAIPTDLAAGDHYFYCAVSSDGASRTTVNSEMAHIGVSAEDFVRFGVLSDIHIGGTRGGRSFTDQTNRFIQALEFYNGQKVDALAISGDVTQNYGVQAEYDELKRGLGYKDPSIRLIASMGNHDSQNAAPGDSFSAGWFEDATGCNPNAHYVVNGFHFITLSPGTGEFDSETGRGTTQGRDNYAYVKAWAERQLAAAREADPGKPIFVFMHHALKDTFYVSDEWYGTGLGDGQSSIFDEYPEAVVFSGHIHSTNSDPRSIWQDGGFTAVNVPSTYYYEFEKGMIYGTVPPNADDCFLGLLVEVKGSVVTIRNYDFLAGQWIDQTWTFDVTDDPESFPYTGKRAEKAQKPVFAADAFIGLSDITSNSATVTFEQAYLPEPSEVGEVVHSYQYELYNTGTGQRIRSFKTWSEFYFLPAPERLSYELTNLSSGIEYELRIYGIGSFQLVSDDYLSIVFEIESGALPKPGFHYAFNDAGEIELNAGETYGVVGKGTENTAIVPDGGVNGNGALEIKRGGYLKIDNNNFKRAEVEEFTISFWVKPTYDSSLSGTGSRQAMFTCYPGNRWFTRYNNGSSGFVLNPQQFGYSSTYMNGFPVPVNEWTCITAVVSGPPTNNTVQFYRNGVLAATTTGTNWGESYTSGQYFLLGWEGGLPGNTDWFEGLYDNVRYYAGTLTSEEIKALYDYDLVFRQVSDVSGIPDEIGVGQEVFLRGKVSPGDATDKIIVWSIKDAGDTNAVISGGWLRAAAEGRVVVTATIADGLQKNKPYTKDFTIIVTEGFEYDPNGDLPAADVLDVDFGYRPVEDRSPNAYTLQTAVGPESFPYDTRLGKLAASFEGNTGNRAYRAELTETDYDQIKGAVSVEAVFKRTEAGNQVVFGNMAGAGQGLEINGSGANAGKLEFWFNVNELGAGVSPDSGTSYLIARSPEPLELNEWYHAVGTFDGRYVRLYVNGEMVAERDAGVETTMRIPAANARRFVVGGNSQNSASTLINYPFTGMISAARVYGRALSGEEIAALAGYGLGSHGMAYIDIDKQPAGTTTVTQGSISGSLSVTASVIPRSVQMGYQWYQALSGDIGTDAEPVGGATGETFAIPTALEPGIHYYYCEVSATGAQPVKSDAAKVVVEKPAPVELVVSVSTPTIVATLAANLAVTVEGGSGESLTAYLKVGDKLLYKTAVTGGRCVMRVTAAPEAGNYELVVAGEGFEGSCDIRVVPYNTNIWEANAYVLEGKLLIRFNEDITLKSGSGCVTIGGVSYNARVLDDKRTIEVLGIDVSALASGTAVSIKGVKYPVLFPSYSFTFTVTVP